MEKDIEKAKELYDKAARNGNPSGYYNLGVLMMKDERNPEGKQKAIEMLQQSAFGGNNKAKEYLSKFSNLQNGMADKVIDWSTLEKGCIDRR